MSLPLDPHIHFLIVVPDGVPEEATPLQGFAFSLCRNSWMIRAASFLPSTIFDLTEEGSRTFLMRRLGGTNPIRWLGQTPRAVKAIPLPAFLPFTILMLGEDQNPSDYEEWVRMSEVPPTIVAKQNGDLSYDQLSLGDLQRRFLKVCDSIPETVDPEDIRRAREAIAEWKPLQSRSLGYKVGGHATIIPNLMALSVCGYDDMVSGRFDKMTQGTRPYIEQIVATTRSVFEERERIGHHGLHRVFRRPPDLNIFAPAIYPHVASVQLSDHITKEERKRFELARTALERQTGYGFETRTDAQLKAMFGMTKHELISGEAQPDVHFLFRIRQMELSLCTECVGSLAAAEISAVVRLPNDINRTAGSVRQFASQYRSENVSSRKRLLAFRHVQNRIEQAFPPELRELIALSNDGIRIISDAHIEWLDVGGLPLGIRKNVSRIPVTPGNLFVDELTAKPPLHFTPEQFRDVLVISALKRTDPIKGLFDTAFKVFEPAWRGQLNLRHIDVSNDDELISALNSFAGPLVIFDGHGSHSPDNAAELHLMDKAIDVWSLRGRIKRPPPIVVLSACDTHAADRNHATTANGFITIGTRAVLSSVFPLDARRAAEFAARLLLRVSQFIPAYVAQFGRALTWTEIVSGLLRMQLLTDFLRQLEAKKLIDRSIYMDVHTKGNMVINAYVENAFEQVLNALIKQGLEPSIVKNELEIAVANSSVISYLNIGRPETILIGSEQVFRELVSE